MSEEGVSGDGASGGGPSGVDVTRGVSGGDRVVRLFGIDVAVQRGWLLGLALITVALFMVGLPGRGEPRPALVAWGLAAVAGVFIFGSMLLHELAHAIVARRLGLAPRRVTLFVAVGGAATLERETTRPAQELIVAASGPLGSLVLAALFGGVAVGLEQVPGTPPVILDFFVLVAAMNGILGLLNLVPAFPLDGGRILRALLWRLGNDFLAATRAAANAGRAIGWMAIGAGLLITLRSEFVTGFTIAVIGWFLSRFATSAYRWAAIQRHVSGVSVGQVMERDVPTVRPNLTLDVFIDQYLMSGTGSAFAVASGEELIGTIDVDRARRTARHLWTEKRIADVMTPLPEVETAREDDPLWPAIERFERGRLHLMPVVDGRRLLGVLTRQGLLDVIRGRVHLAERLRRAE